MPINIGHNGVGGTAGVTRVSWAQGLLQGLGVPVTSSNLQIIVGWELAEGGAGPQFGVPNNTASFNPLNTTQSAAGAATVNGAGVKAYSSWGEGLSATLSTLNNGNYGQILGMLKRGNASPTEAASTIDGSVWGTKDLTASLIASARVTGDNGAPVSPGGAATGGTAGLGGTGTTPNKLATGSPFQVGNTANPDEDYFTAINRLSQGAYWYSFSDGETMYVADGTMLMRQTPAFIINRWSPSVLSMDFTWDNTAFQYASHHKKRARIQRRTSLAKITSPVSATIDLICPIDAVRAGDVVYVIGAGPGDGPWLVGDCTRSVFAIYSELTLVPALSPINAAGVGSQVTVTGKAASRPGAGTVIAAMISMAATINNQDYPYIWGGGHGKAGVPSVGVPGPGFDGHTIGYDCSGSVAAVLAAGGLWPAGSSVGNDVSVIQQLRSSGYAVPGQGNGSPECTLFDNPGTHIFMRLNGQYFGTEDGAGHLPATSRQGAGWIPNGQPGSFQPYHIKQSVLENVVA